MTDADQTPRDRLYIVLRTVTMKTPSTRGWDERFYFRAFDDRDEAEERAQGAQVIEVEVDPFQLAGESDD